MRKNLILVLVLIIVAAVVLIGYKTLENGQTRTDTPEGAAFSTSTNMVRLISPKVGELVSSPLSVTGEARGGWYFEATFPVILTDWDGRIIAEGNAVADGDWMTESFVPFSAVLEFKNPSNAGAQSARGNLILKKANASGLPEHDAALEIPVSFDNQ